MKKGGNFDKIQRGNFDEEQKRNFSMMHQLLPCHVRGWGFALNRITLFSECGCLS